jgi:ribose transport system permease protein
VIRVPPTTTTAIEGKSTLGVGVTLVGVYILSGLCSALVGVLLTGFSGQAN